MTGSEINSQKGKSRSIVVGVAAVSAATIIAEICLTKFISYKLYQHYTYAIISLVMFSFGLSGLTVFIRASDYGADTESHWRKAGYALLAFAFALVIDIPLYCLLPLPANQWAPPYWPWAIAFVCCVVLFMTPFYAAGIGISHTFSAANISVRSLYFWDLLAAAGGAALAPVLLEHCGGYGAMFVASLLGLIAAHHFFIASGTPISGKTKALYTGWCLISIAFLAYPAFAVNAFGFDIFSVKDQRSGAMFNRYGGLGRTFWNAIGRIDISKTCSKDQQNLLTWGLSPLVKSDSLTGRYILVDGGASTRQIRLNEPVEESKVIHTALFGAPYVVRPDCKRAMVIGGGGGIDILIAKHWKIPKLDIIELNPSTYKVLTGAADDPERCDYLPNLASTRSSQINIFNQEGRHFASHQPLQTYDVVQLSGVDTLTAITSGGMSLVENYLYTTDALNDFLRVLKPNGILSITHWRQDPPNCAVRTFNTDLTYLTEHHIAHPEKCLLVIASDYTEIMMKLTPFTDSEIARVAAWAKQAGYEFLYDPSHPEAPTAHQSDRIFSELATAADHAKIADTYEFDISPVSDDRPYFYRTYKPNSKRLTMFHVEDGTHIAFVIIGLLGALLLTFAPLSKVRQSPQELAPYLLFFALSGFSFLLFETSIIQVLGVFVGGPMYSMATVFVAVFLGYAIGSLLSKRLITGPRSFTAASAAAAAVFTVTFFSVHPLIQAAISLPIAGRLLISVALTLLVAIPTGMLVPCAAEQVRESRGSAVAWMWAVNSAFNVLGGLCYVPLSQAVGIRYTFLICAVMYLCGGLLAKTFWSKASAAQVVQA